jgi:hypothetical protein
MEFLSGGVVVRVSRGLADAPGALDRPETYHIRATCQNASEIP